MRAQGAPAGRRCDDGVARPGCRDQVVPVSWRPAAADHGRKSARQSRATSGSRTWRTRRCRQLTHQLTACLPAQHRTRPSALGRVRLANPVARSVATTQVMATASRRRTPASRSKLLATSSEHARRNEIEEYCLPNAFNNGADRPSNKVCPAWLCNAATLTPAKALIPSGAARAAHRIPMWMASRSANSRAAMAASSGGAQCPEHGARFARQAGSHCRAHATSKNGRIPMVARLRRNLKLR